MNVNFDLETGDVFVNSSILALDRNGDLLIPQGVLVATPKNKTGDEKRWEILGKFNIFGLSASLALQANRQRLTSVIILFDEIKFFNKSILESRAVKNFQRKYGVTVTSSHPTIGEIGSLNWGKAYFSYDPRQGDLSFYWSYSDDRKSDASREIEN